MQKKAKMSSVIVLLAVGLVASMVLNMYYIADGSGATVFSRGDETYLFLGNGHTGYHFAYLAYPLVVLREYFNAPLSPADELRCSLVIHITPTVTERHLNCGDSSPAHYVGFLTPFDDSFYALCQGAILCRWTENGFVPATDEEGRRIGGTSGLVKGDMNNQTVNGWKVHRSGLPGAHFEVTIGRDIVLSVRNHATNVREWQYPWVTVDLLRPGQNQQSLYDVNGRPRRATKQENDQTFREQ